MATVGRSLVTEESFRQGSPLFEGKCVDIQGNRSTDSSSFWSDAAKIALFALACLSVVGFIFGYLLPWLEAREAV